MISTAVFTQTIVLSTEKRLLSAKRSRSLPVRFKEQSQ